MYFYCKSLCILIVRPCILNVVYVFLLLSMYSYCSSMYSYCCLSILNIVYVFLDAATLTEYFPCFFLGCKANARVKLAKTGHGSHSSKFVLLFCEYYLNNISETCNFHYVIYVAWRNPSMHSTLRTHLCKGPKMTCM
jgi:hypothetical protein